MRKKLEQYIAVVTYNLLIFIYIYIYISELRAKTHCSVYPKLVFPKSEEKAVRPLFSWHVDI